MDATFSPLDFNIDTLGRKIDCVSSRVKNLDFNVENQTTRLDSVQVDLATFITQQHDFNERIDAKLVALDENTERKFLEIDTHIQKTSSAVNSIEKVVDG